MSPIILSTIDYAHRCNMVNNTNKEQMWNWTIDMNLAVYLSDTPDIQIRKMAKRYKNIANNKTNKRSMGFIIKSASPSTLVSSVYEELLPRTTSR